MKLSHFALVKSGVELRKFMRASIGNQREICVILYLKWPVCSYCRPMVCDFCDSVILFTSYMLSLMTSCSMSFNNNVAYLQGKDTSKFNRMRTQILKIKCIYCPDTKVYATHAVDYYDRLSITKGRIGYGS